jgi:DNA-binding GntR family transcriptional regulator
VRQGALMLDLRASCLKLVSMDTDIPSADLQRLLGVARTSLNDLAKRGIVSRGERKGTYLVERRMKVRAASMTAT